MLYALITETSGAQVESRKHEIGAHKTQRDRAIADDQAALERARRAQSDDADGFFGSIAKIVKDVVDDAAHLRVADAVSDFKDDVETTWNNPHFWRELESGAGSIAKVFNTALAIVAATLCGQFEDAADMLKNPDSATARHYGLVGRSLLALGAGVGTAVSMGTLGPALIAGASVALSASGEAIAETRLLGDASAYVGVGMDVGGTMLTLGMAKAGDAPKIIAALRGAALMVEGGGKAIAALAHARVASFDADAEDALADATAARQRMEQLDRLIKSVLAETKEIQKSHERALESLRAAMEIDQQTLLVAAGARG